MDFEERYNKVTDKFSKPGCTGLVPGDFLVEECAELIQAVQHYKRKRDNAKEHLANEMADVLTLIDCVKKWANISDEDIRYYQNKLVNRYIGAIADGRHIE